MAYKNKEDQAAAARRHYDNNKELMKSRAIAHKKALRAEMVPYVRELKETTPCADCGKIFAYWVMDFDHRPGEDKKFDVSKTGSWSSWKVLRAEIDKCDIVCANCHRMRTHARRIGASFVNEDDTEAYLNGEVDTLREIC